MREDKGPVVQRLAEAITDGTPVDWEAEAAAHQHLKPSLEGMRLIEEVVSAHRTASASTSATADLPAPVSPPTAAAGTSPGIAAWGPLKILGLLGSGAFGEVYRAYDPTLRRDVALKLRRAAERTAGRAGDAADEKFLREARELARVRHPGVLVVHGADRHEGRVGLWTDLLRGRTLEEVQAEGGPLGPREAALIGIDLCAALAAVHAAGLVHRDVKTTNVMREQGGRIVLMDFGSVTDSPVNVRTLDGTQGLSGTPLYMAPELVLAGQAATPASDIYALGVVLYRLVTGRLPIEAQTWGELIEKHQRGEQALLRDVRPDLPAAFVQAAERSLDADPRRRYPSAGAMAQALEAAVGQALPHPVPPPLPWWRRPLPAMTMAAALAVTLAAAWFLLPRIQPVPFNAEAALYRLTPGSDERLRPGGQVRPGDRLFLEIAGPEEMYVYVLNEDAMGNAFVLFPAGLDLDNPLRSGVRHRLPGSKGGRQMTWEVTSAGSKENFFVIASRGRLEDLETEIAQIPRAEHGRQAASVPVNPDIVRRLRGVGGMADVGPAPDGGRRGRLSRIEQSLSTEAARARGLWTWHIELENPGI